MKPEEVNKRRTAGECEKGDIETDIDIELPCLLHFKKMKYSIQYKYRLHQRQCSSNIVNVRRTTSRLP
ncbi:hypothetical protein L5515_008103 [Caenorhabditis briggsae]|uniref:Uncharacterized protein n=1 Tax=Caenorhabditis briggsae TaxID=6238 RepID=A0AAE9F727_CAEBR|nr:hypothetical protein L5515_008103 [Caenorhabditis briggsae]